MNKEDFCEHVNDRGYETMEYSGRGMFGKACLAVVTDETPFEFASKVMSDAKNDERDGLAAVLKHTKQDNMGLNSNVFYWPDLK